MDSERTASATTLAQRAHAVKQGLTPAQQRDLDQILRVMAGRDDTTVGDIRRTVYPEIERESANKARRELLDAVNARASAAQIALDMRIDANNKLGVFALSHRFLRSTYITGVELPAFVNGDPNNQKRAIPVLLDPRQLRPRGPERARSTPDLPTSAGGQPEGVQQGPS